MKQKKTRRFTVPGLYSHHNFKYLFEPIDLAVIDSVNASDLTAQRGEKNITKGSFYRPITVALFAPVIKWTHNL